MAQSRKQKVLQEVKRQRKQRAIISLVIAVALITVIVVGVYALSRNSGPPVNFPFACLAETTTLHVHPWLRIWIETSGSKYNITIPTAVGILGPSTTNGLTNGGSCFEPLHTHDASGIIHVESASTGDKYSLGDFFNVWKATPGYDPIPAANTGGLGRPLPIIFNSTDLLGFRPDSTHTLSVLVDQGQSTYQNYTLGGSLPIVPLDYCSQALGGGAPCSPTAGGNPFWGGGSYPYGPGHTILIYYKAV